MNSYYFDSSALVKGYVAETGSDWISQIMANATDTIYTANISGPEVVAEIFGCAHTGSITITDAQLAVAHLKIDFRTYYQVLEITEPIINSAMILAEKHNLLGYQSVHLATAFALQVKRGFLSLPPVIFVCADQKLNAAATAEGFVVENPNDH
jgi:predicted nucleic acid-binding protein